MRLLLIALGGALGTVVRYLVSVKMGAAPGEFPAGTLAINVTGCVLIGLLVPLLRLWEVREDVQLMVLVGFLGGYTTFSAFGRETWGLIDGGRWGLAALYVGLSNGLGLLGVWVGSVVGRTIGA